MSTTTSTTIVVNASPTPAQIENALRNLIAAALISRCQPKGTL